MDAHASNGTLWVLGDAATVMGFRLAGLRGWVVESAAEARAALDAL
ncbi:MAG: synthase (F/14-kDa) subunit, partial [Deltaproteobacteria bacterium]|nr:synthase (F/14-kDa) subunit [Deltaproteobacteria bacterium]